MKGKKQFTKTESEQILSLIRQKLKADATQQKSIRNKIRNLGFYASDFGIGGGYTEQDFLRVVTIIGNAPSTKIVKGELTEINSTPNRALSDEAYIIGLCEKVLNQKAEKQHRFDFLRGDAGTKLPVDAYFPKLNLVIEFMEKQHSEPVKFFDRKKTVSGISRGEQRKKYDNLRKKLLPENGIDLIMFDYSEFEVAGNKKLKRDVVKDLLVVKKKLLKFS